MVDLDSSTSKKFSRHWILHLPGNELFSDARAVGIFVKGLVSRLEQEQRSEELQARGHELLAAHLFVNDGSEKRTRFIDLGVYTRNRIFRLLGSTKFGKPADAALRIAEANEFPFPRGFDNSKFYCPEMNRKVPTESDDNDCDANDCDVATHVSHISAMLRTLARNCLHLSVPRLGHNSLVSGILKENATSTIPFPPLSNLCLLLLLPCT